MWASMIDVFRKFFIGSIIRDWAEIVSVNVICFCKLSIPLKV